MLISAFILMSFCKFAARGFELIVAPMKIEDGTGAPLRLYARIIN